MSSTASTVSLWLLGIFSGILALLIGREGLYQSLAELTTLVVLLSIGYALTASLDPVDRTGRVALLTIVGMFLLRQGILWHRGEPTPVFSGVVQTVARHGLAAFLVIWTALISRLRPPGQYVYNLVFVFAMALFLGQIAANVVAGAEGGLFARGLTAFVQGAAAGSAVAYITLDCRGTNESGGQPT